MKVDVAFNIIPPRGYEIGYQIQIQLSGFDNYDVQDGALVLNIKGLTYKFPYEVCTLDRDSDQKIMITIYGNSMNESFDLTHKVEAFIDALNQRS